MSDKFTLKLANQALELNFAFNKARFEIVKKLSGAKYDKLSRTWLIPIINLERILNSSNFNLKDNRVDFDLELAKQQYLEKIAAVKLAQSELQRDPFSVASEYLNLLELDSKLLLDDKKDQIIIQMSRQGRNLVQQFIGKQLIIKDKTQFFPADQVNHLLIAARNLKLIFAVEDKLSKKLVASAALRQKAMLNQALTAREYYNCLLQPILDYSQQAVLQLDRSFHKILNIKAIKPNLNDAYYLELILSKALANNLKIWLTRDFIENSSLFESKLIQVLTTKINYTFFVLAEHTPAIIYLKSYESKLNSKVLEVISKGENLYLSAYSQYSVCRFRSRELMPTIEELEQENISLLFKDYLKLFKSNLRHVLRNEEFRKLSDINLDIQNQTLAKKLFPHQRVGVAWLLEMDQALLGDDMGLGKTLSVLCVFDVLLNKQKLNKLVVVCPASLTRNWLREAENWLKHRKLEIVPEGKKARQEFLYNLRSTSPDGIIINYESLRLPYVYPELAEFMRQHNVLLVLDESQRIKNPTGKTFKALSSFAWLAKRRILLSGTPTPKDISDIWAQLFVLDRGERLGKNYYEWLSTVAELGNQYSDYAVRSYKPREVDETILKVQELLLRRKKEEVINLPEKLFSTRDLKLSGEQKRLYDLVRNELVLELTALDGNKFTRDLSNILERYLRAVQVAVNPRLLFDDFQGEPIKFLELDEIVAEIIIANKRKLVVWTNYLKNIDELLIRYPNIKVAEFSGRISREQRDRTIQEFQNSQGIDLLVAIPAAGGVGITLTAAQTAVYLDKTWNAEHWLQSVDRLHRIGQTGTVNIISLHATKVDELLSRNLAKKFYNQAKLLGDVEDQKIELSELLAALND